MADKITDKVFNAGKKVVRKVGKGLNKIESKIDQATQVLAHGGDAVRKAGSAITSSAHGFFAVPGFLVGTPLKGVGASIRAAAMFSRGFLKSPFRVAELVGKGAMKIATLGRKPEETKAEKPPVADPKTAGGFKDKLAEKSERLDRASEFERTARETLVARAEEKGKPLTAEEVMALRKPEEEKRRDEYRKILQERYKNQGR